MWTNQRPTFELDKAVEAEPGPGRMSRAEKRMESGA